MAAGGRVDEDSDEAGTHPGLVVQHATAEVFRSGPLPPPEDFAAYDHALPGSADRILRMAESDLASRIAGQALESKATSLAFLIMTVLQGLVPFAFLVAFVWLTLSGKSGLGALSACASIATVAPSIVIKVRNAFNRMGD